MKKNIRFKPVKGFFLMEAALHASVVAALAIVVFIVWPRVHGAQIAKAEMNTIVKAKARIHQTYRSGDFSTLNNTVVNQRDFAPKDMQIGASNIKNRFNGRVIFEGSNSSGVVDDTSPSSFFRVQYESAPTHVCAKMARIALEKFGAVYVGDTVIKNDFTSTPSNGGDVIDACSKDSATTLVFVSN